MLFCLSRLSVSVSRGAICFKWALVKCHHHRHHPLSSVCTIHRFKWGSAAAVALINGSLLDCEKDRRKFSSICEWSARELVASKRDNCDNSHDLIYLPVNVFSWLLQTSPLVPRIFRHFRLILELVDSSSYSIVYLLHLLGFARPRGLCTAHTTLIVCPSSSGFIAVAAAAAAVPLTLNYSSYRDSEGPDDDL